jgi:hypothetical protein
MPEKCYPCTRTILLPMYLDCTAAPNNAMQPTANSVAFMRETWNVSRLSARRLMASVGRLGH